MFFKGTGCTDRTGGTKAVTCGNQATNLRAAPPSDTDSCKGRGDFKGVAPSFPFHGALGKLFILESTSARLICFRMSVGLISLLHPPTSQQQGAAPEDACRCLKPVFLPPFTEKTLSRAVFFRHQCDLTQEGKKAAPSTLSETQQESGVDQGAPRRCAQSHTSELPRPT